MKLREDTRDSSMVERDTISAGKWEDWSEGIDLSTLF